MTHEAPPRQGPSRESQEAEPGSCTGLSWEGKWLLLREAASPSRGELEKQMHNLLSLQGPQEPPG